MLTKARKKAEVIEVEDDFTKQTCKIHCFVCNWCLFRLYQTHKKKIIERTSYFQ